MKFLFLLTLLLAGALTAQEAGQPDITAKVQVCAACHGPNGASTQPKYPILAGQEFYYLYVQLKDFQSGLRENAEMAPMVANLTRDELKAMAQYFSEQTWPRIHAEADAETIKAGRTAASAGQCPQCHLGGYDGNSRVPRLAGQYPAYLETTMLDFKAKKRNNSPAKSSLLDSFAEADISALAAFLGSLSVQEKSVGAEIE